MIPPNAETLSQLFYESIKIRLGFLKDFEDCLAFSRRKRQINSLAYSKLLLVGGRPFQESILMWWNFVARTPEEIQAARDGWTQGGFGDVKGYESARAAAPPFTR